MARACRPRRARVAADQPQRGSASLAFGALAGVFLIWHQRKNIRHDRGVILAVTLFACYWLATLIFRPGVRRAGKDLEYGRYTFTLSTTIRRICRDDVARRGDVAAHRGRLCGDRGTVAARRVGANLYRLQPRRCDVERTLVRNFRRAGNLKLGPVLAVISPFVFAACTRPARLARSGAGVRFSTHADSACPVRAPPG